ncbi:uncharacterized protein LOC17889958 isoform X3 [Capsella rubella]|nr:uncharacterized protein LOC17889958 isoform X3 [Capsella rubella]
MEAWDEDKDALIDLFGQVRDDWINKDLTTWIGANRFYPGVSDALKFASSKIYIVTTKQGRFAEALLREIAGVIIPSERIYGLGSGPKVEVLKLLQNKPEHQGLTLHFVEDRLATLKNVIKEPELDKWNLYLGGLFPLPYSLFWFSLLVILTKKLISKQETGVTTPRKREQKQQALPGFRLSSSPHLAISLNECILIGQRKKKLSFLLYSTFLRHSTEIWETKHVKEIFSKIQ